MDETIMSLIFFIIMFIIIYIVNYYFILKKKYNIINGKKKSKRKNKEIEIMELSYLITKFNLDKNKMDLLYCIRWIAFLDAFIISLTGTVIFLIPWKIVWQFLVGFVMVFGLIYALYELLGRHLVKKGWNK